MLPLKNSKYQIRLGTHLEEIIRGKKRGVKYIPLILQERKEEKDQSIYKRKRLVENKMIEWAKI